MNQLEDCRQEVELLKKQCESESQTIKNLEDLLTANREKEFASQLSSQEKETELQLYKERLSLSENKRYPSTCFTALWYVSCSFQNYD